MSYKQILIVGANSYIGTTFEKWLSKNPDDYKVDTIGTLNDEWKKISFNKYDSVLHVAGIAHVSADPKMESLYYRVNRDLAIEVANKAKSEGASQFIFMSSIIIYGKDGRIGEDKIITKNTEYAPVDFYGKSKLEADLGIQKLSSENFKTVIIRTPMVYGPGCKGNFPKLINLAKYVSIFPNIENLRSMIYIDNLCEFFRKIIDNNSAGVFYPQNKEYISTKDIISEYRKQNGKKAHLLKILNPILVCLSKKSRFVNKVFGNKVYDKSLSNEFNWDYCVVDFQKSIERCSR